MSGVGCSKRQRLDAYDIKSNPSKKTNHSRILAPFRAIGHTTSSTPFSILAQGRTFQLTTALANTLQTYDIRKLNLVFVSSPTPGEIRRIVSHAGIIYAGFESVPSGPGAGVWIFKRGKKIRELQSPGKLWGAWNDLLVFGDWIVGSFEKGLVVWKNMTGEVWVTLEMDVRAVVHPSAVLNKICVARTSGEVEIWNVKTIKRVYTILPPLPQSSAVTTMVQSPAISVIAIGYSTGEVHLHNIISDTALFTLNVSHMRTTGAHQRRVVSLSFCTSPFVYAPKEARTAAGGRILAVGDDTGHVTLWNLEKQAVISVMWNSHTSSSVNVAWLNGQNVLVTTGADNSIKEWIFDSPRTTVPRILRVRSGHHHPITSLTFGGVNSAFLLTGSLDKTLRAQSLRNDAQSFEYSQGLGVKKAEKAKKTAVLIPETEVRVGPITAIATCAGEDGAGSTGRDWEGTITAHRGERAARCWSFQNKRLGRWKLETRDASEAKSVTISSCGTFGFVGSAKGSIDMYNLQSGIHRRSFPEPPTQAQAKKVKRGEATGKLLVLGKGKHIRSITSIQCDALNHTLISTSLDGFIKFWDFNTGLLDSELSPNAGAITKGKLHRPSELLAISTDDLAIRVIDIVTKKTVRELWGCAANISDFTFSADARWLIAAATDSVIRIWDLPTGHCIDAVRTSSIVTALAFSGTGEFLATAHVDSVGVNLWTNRMLFRHVPSLNIDDTEIVDLSSPTISGIGGTGIITGAIEDAEDENKDETDLYNTRKDKLEESIITLSLVPKTRWQTLLNLDVIRARNKPLVLPKIPEKAPFFLGSTSDALPSAREAEDSRVLRIDVSSLRSGGETSFSQALRGNDYAHLLNVLKALPPSQADLEIRNLEGDEVSCFMEALTRRLQEKRDYELVNAWMKVFLRLHGKSVAGNEALRERLNRWREVSSKEGGRLGERIGYVRGMCGFLRGTR